MKSAVPCCDHSREELFLKVHYYNQELTGLRYTWFTHALFVFTPSRRRARPLVTYPAVGNFGRRNDGQRCYCLLLFLAWSGPECSFTWLSYCKEFWFSYGYLAFLVHSTSSFPQFLFKHEAIGSATSEQVLAIWWLESLFLVTDVWPLCLIEC